MLALVAVVGLGPSLPARARADLGDKSVVSLGVDRLFGFSNTHVNLSAPFQASGSRTEFALLMNSSSSAYTTPRLAADVGVADHVTVGGAVGIIIAGVSGTSTSGGVSNDTGSNGTGVILAPRVGYVLGLGTGGTRLWLRGGFSYFQTSSKEDRTMFETSTRGFALDLEPTFVFMLAPHVGVTVSAVLDLPLTGEIKGSAGGTSQGVDMTIRCLGILAGLTLPL